MKKLVCNLKTGIDYENFKKLLISLNDFETNVEMVVAPPYPFINMIPENIKRASQDISMYDDSFAVGEVTAKILKSISTDYVIVGHSDRQNRFNESEYGYIKKINNALKEGLKVIFCVGESREQKLRNKTLIVLEREIARVFNKLDGKIENIILAYEPAWAISNNKNDFDNINVSEVSETIIFIKKLVKDYYDIDIDVLYGGSVNAKNIDQYRNLKSDGLLIGQASLNVEDVKRIANKL